jgi:cell division septation protein DedD
MGICVLAVAMLVGGASFAVAASRNAKAKTPSARVQIEGGGSIYLRGSLVIFGEIGGPTDLVVQDEAGGGRIAVGNRSVKLKKDESRRFSKVSGRIYLEGRAVQVRFVDAPKMRLSVSAIGSAQFLSGSGKYQLNASVPAPWPAANVTVDLTPGATVVKPPSPTPGPTPTPTTTTTPTTTAPTTTQSTTTQSTTTSTTAPAKTTTTAPAKTTTIAPSTAGSRLAVLAVT